MLSSRNGWKPAIIINEKGHQEQLGCFEKVGAVEAQSSCAITWKNQLYIFGGWTEPRQVSLLSHHRLERISSLEFTYASSACAVVSDEVYLCFNGRSYDDSKVCRKSKGPLKAFSEVLSSKFHHWAIQLSYSESKFFVDFVELV